MFFIMWCGPGQPGPKLFALQDLSATLTTRHVDGWRRRIGDGGEGKGERTILTHQPNSQTVAEMVSEVALFRGTSGQKWNQPSYVLQSQVGWTFYYARDMFTSTYIKLLIGFFNKNVLYYVHIYNTHIYSV